MMPSTPADPSIPPAPADPPVPTTPMTTAIDPDVDVTANTATDTADTTPRFTRNLHLLLLIVCGGLLLVTGLGDMGLTDRDEGRNAEAAREMLETGDWISPTLNYEPRYAKPALTYWINAAAYAVLGVHDVAARLPSAAFGLALLLLHYGFLRRVLGPTVALYGALALLLNLEFTTLHRMALTDPALVFFTTLAVYGFWLGLYGTGRDRRYIWLLYVGMALATLAKGPVGVIIPLLGIVPYLTLTRQWPTYVAAGRPALGWAVFALIAAPWYIAMFAIHGADYAVAAAAHTTGRFANPMEGHGGTLLFYVPVILLGLFPWIGFLPSALAYAWRIRRSWRTCDRTAGENGVVVFCALWVVGIFAFFTLSATRLPHYILPLYPPATLLVAVLWSRFLSQTSPRGLTASTRTVLVTGYLISGLLVSLPLVYDTWRHTITTTFPAAARVDIGPVPVVLGVIVLLGVTTFRFLMEKEARRPLAFGTLAGMTGVCLLVVILFVLPRVGRYFVNPPQALATIAGFNLDADDRLMHFGRKLPSLSFYAQRRVYHVNPVDTDDFAPHVARNGRLMVILPSHLHDRLPAPVSSFPSILQRYGFLLLSSDPVVNPHPAAAADR